MNNMEEIFKMRSCIEILANDIKICTIYEYTPLTQPSIPPGK